MRKSTAVCVAIMATSFALSIVCLFVSLGFYALSGTKEVAERIYTGEWDDIPEKFDFIDADGTSFEIDLPSFHFIADDLGVDVEILCVKIHTRDEDEASAREALEDKNEKAEEKKEEKDAGKKDHGKKDHDGKGNPDNKDS